jgi:hypothetical protein
MEIKTKDYSVWYDDDKATVFCVGFLRLDGSEEYQPIMDLLLKALEKQSDMTVDLQGLEFLNSSGISMLSQFVLKARQKGGVNLTFEGSDKILWQTKSLKNLQRLMPAIALKFS